MRAVQIANPKAAPEFVQQCRKFAKVPDDQVKAGASVLLFFLSVQFGFRFVDEQVDNICSLINSEAKKRALRQLASAQQERVQRLLDAEAATANALNACLPPRLEQPRAAR